MAFSISPTQDDIFGLLSSFITKVCGVEAVQGQVNRTAEPGASDYAIMWPLRMPRLATNIDGSIDAVFTGSIAGTTMTISGVDPRFTGKIAVGSTIFGVGVADGTQVTAFGTGHGGVGAYTVTPSQSISSKTLAAGTTSLLQKAECVIQCDVHGPNAMNNAGIIATTFRDDYAVEFFFAGNVNIAPLYADDPRQMPFTNDQNQFEDRWVVEAHIQINQTVVIPQEFAAVAEVDVISVDATYPPV